MNRIAQFFKGLQANPKTSLTGAGLLVLAGASIVASPASLGDERTVERLVTGIGLLAAADSKGRSTPKSRKKNAGEAPTTPPAS